MDGAGTFRFFVGSGAWDAAKRLHDDGAVFVAGNGLNGGAGALECTQVHGVNPGNGCRMGLNGMGEGDFPIRCLRVVREVAVHGLRKFKGGGTETQYGVDFGPQNAGAQAVSLPGRAAAKASVATPPS